MKVKEFINTALVELLGAEGARTAKARLVALETHVLLAAMFVYLVALVIMTKMVVILTLLALLAVWIVTKLRGGLF